MLAGTRLRALFVPVAAGAAFSTHSEEANRYAIAMYDTATPGAVAPESHGYGGGGTGVPGYATVLTGILLEGWLGKLAPRATGFKGQTLSCFGSCGRGSGGAAYRQI